MSGAPVHRLNKKEIIWLANHKCKHSMSYLEHFRCYETEVLKGRKYEAGKDKLPIDQKVGYFDIEASNLTSSFGIILCYCIKDADSDIIYSDCVTKEDLQTDLDKNVVKSCIEDLKRFDRVIGYYSTKFDIPYTRSRAVVHNLPFGVFGSLLHTDCYYIVKHKFKLHSNRLETAYETLVGPSYKTPIKPAIWIKALQGDKDSLNFIVDHCQRDVHMLQELYEKISDFSRRKDTSI